ncbi:hypothetical protein AS033_14430 [Exiguobacterium indicum]|uniref:Uncharacterized protein n=1 Tax=Exiguobacterium indicum TaxID=296995 RepID=A0A0V8GCI4_9BACL|nr:hypothetical protein AS033_14430 [Exiguobacterium enclense]SDD29408.1 hypothetical protein SAMN05216342_2938 [Exiguobacterium enclense]
MIKKFIKYFLLSFMLLVIILNLLNGRMIENERLTLAVNIAIVLMALFFISLRFSKRKRK